MLTLKLKGGALYVSVIISILVSIILTLFIVIANFNLQSVQSQASLSQLQLSLESGFEMAKSEYYNPQNEGSWQKMAYNNDSVVVRKTPWGCFTLIDVKAKNAHFKIQQTGLFGCNAFKDTALIVAEQNRPVGLAGKIKFNGYCYLPKAGIKSAYIEGTSFSDLNSVRDFIKSAPNYIPSLDPIYLKDIELIQSQLNNNSDSLLSFIPDELNQSFKQKTAVVQQGSILLSNVKLSNNIKLIAANIITVENNCDLNNVLLIARKVIFKTKFKGNVHVIAKDSIITEDECEFNYPSSFCVYSNAPSKTDNPSVRGIFFGKECKFKGGLLAANDKSELSRMMINVNSKFELIGNLYSSNYADAQGNLYGYVFCQTLLLQTPSGVYENHLLNCNIDPKKYNTHLVVPNWLLQKEKNYVCAQWF
jgi:hypothetical protein